MTWLKMRSLFAVPYGCAGKYIAFVGIIMIVKDHRLAGVLHWLHFSPSAKKADAQ